MDQGSSRRKFLLAGVAGVAGVAGAVAFGSNPGPILDLVLGPEVLPGLPWKSDMLGPYSAPPIPPFRDDKRHHIISGVISYRGQQLQIQANTTSPRADRGGMATMEVIVHGSGEFARGVNLLQTEQDGTPMLSKGHVGTNGDRPQSTPIGFEATWQMTTSTLVLPKDGGRFECLVYFGSRPIRGISFSWNVDANGLISPDSLMTFTAPPQTKEGVPQLDGTKQMPRKSGDVTTFEIG